jgi:protein-disulfide isomerase
MPSNSPSGRPQQGSQATSRRSARQQRIAAREANRNLYRASTRGGGSSVSPLVLVTIAAVVIGVVVLGAAFLLTSQKGGSTALGSPIAPQGSMVTPTGITANGRTLGNADAKVTIDIYEDFQCTNCWTFTHTIEPQVLANYVATGKAKLVWHDFLVIDANLGGTESLDAANAALCANDQGKFWQYHDWLFANQYAEGSGAFTKDRLKAIAAAMGSLDTAKFNSCVDAGTHNTEVSSSKPPSGITGTPGIVVNGTALSSYGYDSIAAAVDGVLGITPSPTVSVTPKATATPTSTVSASASAKAS